MTTNQILFSALILGSFANNAILVAETDSEKNKILLHQIQQSNIEWTLKKYSEKIDEIASELNNHLPELEKKIKRLLEDCEKETALNETIDVNLALNHKQQ